MYYNEDNYMGQYGNVGDNNYYNPAVNADRQQMAGVARPPYAGGYQPYYAQVVEAPREPVKKRKNRTGLKIAITAVSCMLLMFGSGLIGAKITENRFNVQPSQDAQISQPSYAGETTQPNNPDSDIFTSDNYNDNSNGRSNDNGNGSGSGAIDQMSINPSGDTLSLTELFKGANPAVVAISTETTGYNAFGRVVTLPAAGSGFIISEDGYIVTNNHVIEDASSILVALYNGEEYPATLVGHDPESDLAVLKIDAKDLSYLTWGDSGALEVGEQVAAIGNPLGEFANSMTVGYISALDREINIDGTPRNMLQTDTAVNEGNSGGPLLNLQGRVIGIVSAKSSGMNVEGLGFAIPSDKAKEITSQIIQYGYVRGRAVMGVQVGMQDDDGKLNVYVDSVSADSAAEKAGVLAGDIILSANGVTVSSISELKGIINDLSPGDSLALTIQRDGKEIKLTVILGESIPSDYVDPGAQGNQPPNMPYEGQEIPFDQRGIFPGFDPGQPQDE